MPGGLIFTFQNGIGLSLSREKIEEGAVIEFNLNFEQVEIEYKDATLNIINQAEFKDREPVLKFKCKEQNVPEKKRKFNKIDEAEPVNSLSAEDPEVKVKLTRTQKRNRNRRKHKMLEQLKLQGEEASVRDAFVTNDDSERTPAVQNSIVQQNSPAKAKLKSVINKEITVEVQKDRKESLQVEPYVPQFVSRPRQLQIISEYELEKYQRVRKQNFEHLQKINGKPVNILEGLELFTNVFSEREQREIVDRVFDLRDRGRAGDLKGRTYAEPGKWMRGKGRITIQYGCCYNFTDDGQGNLPGILQHDRVDPLPSFIKRMIRRMVAWRVLPTDCIPNSCIVNIYERDDCIPPHIDNHDFLRPFSTVSFMSECDILFGTTIRIAGPGEFVGTAAIPLPVGSVLILNGNGANLSKHCIPGVPRRRISITLRRMREDKIPAFYKPDYELENLQSLQF